MNHLLLDLAKQKAKPKTKAAAIPFKHARCGLMVSLKQAKKLICPDEPHSVYVLPERKASAAIARAAADILQQQPGARLAVVSPRKKVKAAVAALRGQYPEADILYKKRAGKTVRAFLKRKIQAEAAATEALEAAESGETRVQADDDTADENQLIRNAAKLVQSAAAKTHTPQDICTLNETAPPEKTAEATAEAENKTVATAAEAAAETDNATASEPDQTEAAQPSDTAAAANGQTADAAAPHTVAALLLLKKNRPKKKADLIRLLAQHPDIGEARAEETAAELERSCLIRIDAAQNVRYAV